MGKPVLHAREIAEGRQQIDQGDGIGAGRPCPPAVRIADDEGHPARPLIETPLLHHASFAQHVAVIAGEYHHRVLRQAGLVQGVQQAADLVVHVAHQRIIGAAKPVETLFVPQVVTAGTVIGVQVPVHHGMAFFQVGRKPGQLDLRIFVPGPIGLGRPERFVGMVIGRA